MIRNYERNGRCKTTKRSGWEGFFIASVELVFFSRSLLIFPSLPNFNGFFFLGVLRFPPPLFFNVFFLYRWGFNRLPVFPLEQGLVYWVFGRSLGFFHLRLPFFLFSPLVKKFHPLVRYRHTHRLLLGIQGNRQSSNWLQKNIHPR